jgi:hypothetical protein
MNSKSVCAPLVAATAFVVQFQLLAGEVQAHSDVFLAQVSGQVAVGGANELGTVEENYDLTTQVFEGVMISNFPPFNPADYGRDEPGIDALASGSPLLPPGASALTANSPVTINVVPFKLGNTSSPLYYWNGTGAVNFLPIKATQPEVAMALDPNPIGTTGASGALHEHPAFTLDNGAAGVPADGVYLISPTASVPGLIESPHFYMLWLVDALLDDEEAAEGLEEAFENGESVYLGKDFAFFPAAIEYVETNVVPEPATGSLGVAALVGLIAMARRRPVAKSLEA